MDSKVDKPCLFPVLTIERIIANKSRPQLERNPFVIFLNMTLQRRACSLELFVGGMVGSYLRTETSFLVNPNNVSAISPYHFGLDSKLELSQGLDTIDIDIDSVWFQLNRPNAFVRQKLVAIVFSCGQRKFRECKLNCVKSKRHTKQQFTQFKKP
jgi:hypothetical protein